MQGETVKKKILRMSFASLSRRRPQFNPNPVYLTLVVENRQWGKLFSEYSPLVSLCHYHTSFAPHSFVLPPPMLYNVSNWQCLKYHTLNLIRSIIIIFTVPLIWEGKIHNLRPVIHIVNVVGFHTVVYAFKFNKDYEFYVHVTVHSDMWPCIVTFDRA